jgi:hypothetical protein
MCNHSQLSHYIVSLINAGINIQAIALQEIWAIQYPELVYILDFTLVTNTRSNSRGGGVGFYVRDHLKYKIIENLSPFIENTLESLTVELTTNRKKSLL